MVATNAQSQCASQRIFLQARADGNTMVPAKDLAPGGRGMVLPNRMVATNAHSQHASADGNAMLPAKDLDPWGRGRV